MDVASYSPLGLRALYLFDIEIVLVDTRLRRVGPVIVVKNILDLALSSSVVPFSFAFFIMSFSAKISAESFSLNRFPSLIWIQWVYRVNIDRRVFYFPVLFLL